MIKPNQLYKHYKGGVYKILCLAKESDSSDDMVIYQSQDTGLIWARKLHIFSENIEFDNTQRPRFLLIDDVN